MLCVWSRMFKSYAEKPALVGVEYSEHLLSVCKSNLQILKCENVKLFHSDVLAFSFDDDFVHRIIYLYNPFDGYFTNVLLNLRRSGTFIIYNNPVFDELFRELGFKGLKMRSGGTQTPLFNIRIYLSNGHLTQKGKRKLMEVFSSQIGCRKAVSFVGMRFSKLC